MPSDFKKIPTACVLCGATSSEATEVYPERLDDESVGEHSYAACRYDGKIGHFRVVKCLRCGLLRSDPIFDTELIAKLYDKSPVTSAYQASSANLARTYAHYLEMAALNLSSKSSLLDIGCGNGALLAMALSLGFPNVTGVEPSEEAIRQADPKVRSHIMHGVFKPNLFEPNSFDAVCLFQVIEHVPNPLAVLRESLRLLRPDGVFVALNHDLGSWSVRLAGESSPVIDLEHLHFFNRRTMRLIFEKAGFEIVEQGRAWNYHSLSYLASLIGLKVKSSLTLHLPIGNQYLIARKK